MKSDFWRQLFRPEQKKLWRQVATALTLGVVLLFCSRHFFADEEVEQEQVESVVSTEVSQERPERRLEEEMEKILSQVSGAGQVRVMVTYRTTKESIPAREEKREETSRQEEESIGRESTVVLMENENGGQSPLILSELAPEVEGVVIVAQGGDNAVVQDALNRAAQALLQVPAHKIAILKMK
ncbi:MAG TPA: hypothetical protein H9733_09155 [Candidatus Anaerotignum merdipullorum]|nr:hypothetical protein [Candidatus Anaerotignum merdipullorum]